MGKAVSMLKRPFKNYNVESRAHKIISQEKPVPAPKYEADQTEIERLMKENASEFQESLQKHTALDLNLKNVFVTSKNTIMKGKSNPEKPLPVNRSSYEEPTFGIVEPEKVSQGKVTLVNALKFVTNHYADPIVYSAASIAKEHSLPEATVRNVLRYCKTFQIYIPQNKHSKGYFAGPSIQTMQVTTKPLKKIDLPEQKKIDGT